MEHFAKVSSYPGKHMFLCYHVKDFPFVVIQVNAVRASCSECTPKLLDVYTILSAERLNLIFFLIQITARIRQGFLGFLINRNVPFPH